MNKVPDLVPGPAFHLEGDGQWDVQELPRDVLRRALYTGEVDIDGYPAVVFEMPDGSQWAQKSPGTPSPKGDEASDALSQMAARVASPILDMLREFGVTDEVGLWHWIHKNRPDAYDEAERRTLENVRKAFAKAFPGEKLDAPDHMSNNPDMLKHEVQHIVSEPDFDLAGAGTSRSKVESAMDEMSMMVYEADGQPLSEWGNDNDSDISVPVLGLKDCWSDGMTVGDYLDALDAQKFVSPVKGKYLKNAVSFLRNKKKGSLDEALDEDGAHSLAALLFDRVVSYLEKNNEMAPDPAREAKYKTFRRLLSKYQSDLFSEIKRGKDVSASTSGPFLRMAKRLVALESGKPYSARHSVHLSKVEMEQSQLRSVRALLDELKSCRAALDKAVQHSRSLKNDPSLEWVHDQLEAKQDELSGLATGIRESLEYLTRMDIEP